VVVDDLDVVSIAAEPTEADSELVVDADAVLPEAVAGQLFIVPPLSCGRIRESRLSGQHERPCSRKGGWCRSGGGAAVCFNSLLGGYPIANGTAEHRILAGTTCTDPSEPCPISSP